MKTWVKLFAVVILVIMSVAVFAAENTGTMTVSKSVNVAGKQLAAGEYKVTWTSDGKVQIMQGKKTVVETTAKVVEEKDKAANDYVSLSQNDVKEIRFHGKTMSLVFE
jgi:ABC-type thiamine transport system substrate-binding protein